MLTARDQVKFVLNSRADYEWARQAVAEHGLANVCEVLFSPVWGRLTLQTLAEWILQDRLPVRLQTQWHKVIWGTEVKGV